MERRRNKEIYYFFFLKTKKQNILQDKGLQEGNSVHNGEREGRGEKRNVRGKSQVMVLNMQSLDQ